MRQSMPRDAWDNRRILERLEHEISGDKGIMLIIVDKLSDRAMHTSDHLDTRGGIDLGNINVQSRGEGGVLTAFDDKAQLAILIKCGGLAPVIENVQSLSTPVINHLLGVS